MGAKEDITAKVNAKGDEIRAAKKAKAAKDGSALFVATPIAGG